MSTEKPIPALDPTVPPRSVLAERRASRQRLDMTPPPAATAPLERAPPKKYYSASRRGFFSEEIHGDKLPDDVVEITHAEWQALLRAQNHEGKQIVPGPNGKPITVNQVVTPEMKRQLIEMQIDAIRRAPDTLDLQRAAALGRPGARDQLEAVDRQIEALRATLPKE